MAELLGRAAVLGLVEPLDAATTPLLRRAFGSTVDRDEVLVLRVVPASARAVQEQWLRFPLGELAATAPLLVDLSSIQLPADVVHSMLGRLADETTANGRACVVTGSFARRADLYSLGRPRLAVFTTVADALQALVFSAAHDARPAAMSWLPA
ncbi:MAG: hypothetical protein R2749_02575 [Acidimicrobiales bacterium]